MPQMKMVDGKMVPMTDAEYAAFQQEQAAVPEPAQVISPLEFMERFTKAERTAIRTKRATNADLADFFELLSVAPRVTLNDPRVIAGMALLVTLGTITAARRTAILGNGTPAAGK